jgi:hypothetical protein
MIYHILNGDAMIDRFVATGIQGEMISTRECMIDGSLAGNSLADFYQTRAKFISGAYGEKENDYYTAVVSEFDKLLAADNPSEFNLWFGYDLFCQANMWFVLSLLNRLTIQKKVFAVYPSHLREEDRWNDFGGATPADFITCLQTRIQFGDNDLELANQLWLAYKNNDLDKLEKLSNEHSPCFPYLHEVCRAHIERFPKNNEKGRPEKVIEEIIQSGTTEFYSVFKQFYNREGIYGFGDLQLKVIYDKVLLNYC